MRACPERSRAIAVIAQRAKYTAREEKKEMKGAPLVNPMKTPSAAQEKFRMTEIGNALAAATSAPFAR